MKWEFYSFDSLNTRVLFALMKLRVDVFVVEQQCAYPELDDYDTTPDTLHLLGHDGDQLVAYARAMPSAIHADSPNGQFFDHDGYATSVKIGRVVVSRSHRGSGAAQNLMSTMLRRLDNNYPDRIQILSAQEPVKQFYAALGFEPISDVYLEDNIPHIDMRRQPRG